MAWTADGLLLVCIIKRGSLLILPCMGRPLQLVTCGCSLDMGPSILLPLHPRISYMYVNKTAVLYSHYNKYITLCSFESGLDFQTQFSSPDSSPKSSPNLIFMLSY